MQHPIWLSFPPMRSKMFHRVGSTVFFTLAITITWLVFTLTEAPPHNKDDGWTLDLGTGEMVNVIADLDILTLQTPDLTSVVLDSKGNELANLHGEQDRQPVELKDISRYAQQAVVAIEDRRFYEHDGVDTRSIARAFFTNFAAGGIKQGGSTITQQLAKNAVVGDAVSLERKIKEASVALQLETQYSKDEILEHYLNLVYFGGGAHGIKAAAQRWFNVQPSDLSISQSALLAGMLKSPTNYHPVIHPENALQRRNLVIDQMLSADFINKEEAEAAKAEPLNVRRELTGHKEWQAPYAVSYLLQQLQHDSTFQVLGSDPVERANRIFAGGLRIHTTIDPDWQASAQGAAAKVIPVGSRVDVGLVAQEPSTGRIKALVGGLNPYDPNNATAAFNMATQARRQPGSSFKPVVLAAAIEAGKRLDDVYSAPTSVSIKQKNGTIWNVSNAGHANYGHLDLRAALALSSNTAFAQLITDIGVGKVLGMAVDLGIESPLPAVPSVALGAGEVTVLDMSTAMSTLADGGQYHKPVIVDYITDDKGGIIWQNPGTVSGRSIDVNVSWATTRAMQAVVEEGTGKAAYFGRPLAGKTGTSQNFADAWFVGFTPDIAMAVWTGVPSGQVPMEPPVTPIVVNGGNWPAQIFRHAASGMVANMPISQFKVPKGESKTVKIDKNRGCLPNRWTPLDEIEEVTFPKGQEPKLTCLEPSAPVAISVPPVTHMKVEAARIELSKLGLRVVEKSEYNLEYPPGTVVSQDPPAGKYDNAKDGLTVTVKVATTNKTGTVMPDLKGLSISAARASLPKYKGVLNTIKSCPDDDPLCLRGESGTIWAQTPKAGKPLGDNIPIVLSVYP